MRRPCSRRLLASLAASGLLLVSSPSLAATSDTLQQVEDIAAKSVDAAIVRPLASVRALIGVLLFVPAAALASPSGKEGIDDAYEVLVSEPIEYAFERKLGDF